MSIQSSFAWNSGSVLKSHMLFHSSVDSKYGTGGVAARVRREVECGSDDFVRVTDTAQGRLGANGIDELSRPRLGDVGAEGAAHDRVDAYVRSERVSQALGQRVQAGLGRRIGKDRRVRADRCDRGDVEDRAAS